MEKRTIYPENIPKGSKFKGYDDFIIQEIALESLEIKFRLAVYQTPDGSLIKGQLPKKYCETGHYGPELKAYILSQYHQCQVLYRPKPFRGVTHVEGETGRYRAVNKI